MKFKEMHPDYQNYASDRYVVNDMPREFFSAFQGLIIGAVDDSDYASGNLKRICDIIAKNIPTKPTLNTGYSWLLGDLDDFMGKLYSKKLPKILDTISEIVEEIGMDLDYVNEELEELSFGYKLDWNKYDGYVWIIMDGTENRIESVEEALKEIPSTQTNVIEHLKQAKKQILDISEGRSRKDALRDCVSALEAQLKYYTNTKKLEEAVPMIKNQYDIPRKIIGDAKLIWDRIHEQTPDVRHGSQINSDLSEAEALYWIDRLAALVKYLAREIED